MPFLYMCQQNSAHGPGGPAGLTGSGWQNGRSTEQQPDATKDSTGVKLQTSRPAIFPSFNHLQAGNSC
jgi:hypothetical protein